MIGLTEKQRRFIAEYLKGASATDACLDAGYQAVRSSAASIACRLLKKPKIREAIAAGRERLAATAEFDREEMILELRRTHKAAMEAGRCALAVKTLQLLGQLCGLFEPPRRGIRATRPKGSPDPSSMPIPHIVLSKLYAMHEAPKKSDINPDLPDG